MEKEKPTTNKQLAQRKVVLFDGDEFYGLTIDMVLFNLQQPSAFKVNNKPAYEQFKKDLAANMYKSGIYIMDEFFGNGNLSRTDFVAEIKKLDPDATVICYTVSQPEEVEEKAMYSHFILKSGKSNENSLIKILSEILQVDFVMNNNDPEYELSDKHSR